MASVTPVTSVRRLERRNILLSVPAAGLALLGVRSAMARPVRPIRPDPILAPPPAMPAWPGFPQNDPALALAVVTASHGNEPKVREIVDKHPALANATIDWGFGDWESAIGAAAHTGRRSIAEYLVSRGARVDIFAATMLGWLDVVRALLAASPGIQKTPGPHGLTLLHHARAGGDQARPVLEYLEQAGGADEGPQLAALDEADRAAVEGVYEYGQRPDERFTIRSNKQFLEFAKEGNAARRLSHLGDREFFPSGAPAVRFRFRAGSSSNGVAIADHDLSVAAQRVG